MLSVFPTRGSWATMLNDTWWLQTPEGFRGVLEVGMPLWPGDGDLSTAASGGYNAEWERLGRLLEEKFPGSYVRPGWEMNIPDWAHKATPDNAGEWTKAFEQAAAAIKRGGPSIKITWNPNKGRGGSLPDARMAYPADDSNIDVIGIDAYDWYPAYTQESIPEHRDGDQGWQFWVDFARSKGKKFAVPEWGVYPGSDKSGGDNPVYIDFVYGFLAENKDIVAYENYFHENANYIKSDLFSSNPKASAAYKAAMEKAPQALDRATAIPSLPLTAPQLTEEWVWDPGVQLWGKWQWDSPSRVWRLVEAQAGAPEGQAEKQPRQPDDSAMVASPGDDQPASVAALVPAMTGIGQVTTSTAGEAGAARVVTAPVVVPSQPPSSAPSPQTQTVGSAVARIITNVVTSAGA